MHKMSKQISHHQMHYKYVSWSPLNYIHNTSSTMSSKHYSLVFLLIVVLLTTSSFATSRQIPNPKHKNVAEKTYDQILPSFDSSVATLSQVGDPWDDDPDPAPIEPDPFDPYEPDSETESETKRINPTNAKIPPAPFDYKPVFEKPRFDQISSSFDSSVAKLSKPHEDHFNHDPFEPNLSKYVCFSCYVSSCLQVFGWPNM